MHIKTSTFFIISTLFLLFFVGACQPPNAHQMTDNQPLPTSDTTPISKGSMTNEPIENMVIPDIGETAKLSHEELRSYIKEAIIPSYQNWLIFRNGTYIVFDNVDTIPDVKKAALNWLAHYKPKTPADNHWEYSITDLDRTEGWAVFGNGYGIYTFVHAKELSDAPSPQQIAAYAKAKRALDEKKPEIIYVNHPK